MYIYIKNFKIAYYYVTRSVSPEKRGSNIVTAGCALHNKRCRLTSKVCSMSESLGDGGVIYVSFKEGGRLYYKNSGRVVNKYSEIALYSLETRTSSDNIDKHQTVSIRCSALDITSDNAGILRHFFVPSGKSRNTTDFRKLYFKPVCASVDNDSIYFECINKTVSLEYIVLLHRSQT